MVRKAARTKVVSAVVVLSVAIRGHRCPRLSGRRAALDTTNVRRVSESSLACGDILRVRGHFLPVGDVLRVWGRDCCPPTASNAPAWSETHLAAWNVPVG